MLAISCDRVIPTCVHQLPRSYLDNEPGAPQLDHPEVKHLTNYRRKVQDITHGLVKVKGNKSKSCVVQLDTTIGTPLSLQCYHSIASTHSCASSTVKATAFDKDLNSGVVTKGNDIFVSFIMGLAYNVYLNSTKIYGCKNCKAHLANHEDIISRVCSLDSSPTV